MILTPFSATWRNDIVRWMKNPTIDGTLDLTSGQIKFPAIQNPSSDPNTLDDYEEGTWTPTVAFGGASSGVTYSKQVGWYRKVGSIVIVGFEIQLSNKGTSAGVFQLTALPFAVQSATDQYGSSDVAYYSGFTGITGTPFAYLSAGTSHVNWLHPSSTVATDITDAEATNSARLVGTAVYKSE